MEYFFNKAHALAKRMQPQNCILMFDFDGTLAEIAKTPKGAGLRQSTKSLLFDLSKMFYVAIVSGREITDLKSKAGLQGLIYAGNHGMQWEINGSKKDIEISLQAKKALGAVKKEFQKIAPNWQGLLIEDKYSSLSVHYRLLPEKDEKHFLKQARNIISSFADKKLLSIIRGKKVLDFHPKNYSDKGVFANFFISSLQKENPNLVNAVYIGDDKTDEYAFKALAGQITIRMGSSKRSKANYYVEKNEIERLMIWLTQNRDV